MRWKNPYTKLRRLFPYNVDKAPAPDSFLFCGQEIRYTQTDVYVEFFTDSKHIYRVGYRGKGQWGSGTGALRAYLWHLFCMIIRGIPLESGSEDRSWWVRQRESAGVVTRTDLSPSRS